MNSVLKIYFYTLSFFISSVVACFEKYEKAHDSLHPYTNSVAKFSLQAANRALTPMRLAMKKEEYLMLLETCLNSPSTLTDRNIKKIIVGTLSAQFIPENREHIRFSFYLLKRFKFAKGQIAFLNRPFLSVHLADMIVGGENMNIRNLVETKIANGYLGVLSKADLSFFERSHLFNLVWGFGRVVEWTGKNGQRVNLDIHQGSSADLNNGLSGIHDLALNSLIALARKQENLEKKKALYKIHGIMKRCSIAFSNFLLILDPALPYNIQEYYQIYMQNEICPFLVIIPGHIFGVVFAGSRLYIRDTSSVYIGTIRRYKTKLPGFKLGRNQFTEIFIKNFHASGFERFYYDDPIKDNIEAWNSYPQPSGLCSLVSFTGLVKIVLNLEGFLHEEYKEFMKICRISTVSSLLDAAESRHYNYLTEIFNDAIMRSPDRENELFEILESKNILFVNKSTTFWDGEVSRRIRMAAIRVAFEICRRNSDSLVRMSEKFNSPHPKTAKRFAEGTFETLESGEIVFNGNIEAGIFWIISEFDKLDQFKHYPKLKFMEHILPLFERMGENERLNIISRHGKSEVSSLYYKVLLFNPILSCTVVEMLFKLSFNSFSEYYRLRYPEARRIQIDLSQSLTARGLLLVIIEHVLTKFQFLESRMILDDYISKLSSMRFDPYRDSEVAIDIWYQICLPILATCDVITKRDIQVFENPFSNQIGPKVTSHQAKILTKSIIDCLPENEKRIALGYLQ